MCGWRASSTISGSAPVARVYRGRDLEWWMDAAGVLDERYDQVDDIARARRVPSLQLAGTPDRSTLDLNVLSNIGVRLVGRLAPEQILVDLSDDVITLESLPVIELIILERGRFLALGS